MRRVGKHLSLAILALVFLGGTALGQSLRWSQYYDVLPTLNPASTGAFGGDYRLMANYRMSQYAAGDPFTTIYASYDQGIKKHEEDGSAKNTFFAVGLSFLNDNAGIGSLTTQEVGAMFSFNLKIAKLQFISVGARLAYGSRSVNFNDFQWTTQYNPGDGSFDPTLPSDPSVDYAKVTYLPISTGLMWTYVDPERLKFNLGFALNRLNQPDVAFDPSQSEKLPMVTAVHLGAEWYIPQSIVSLMPLIMYQSRTYYNETNIGLFAKWHLSFDSKLTHIKKTSILYTGMFYRTNGDIILATKFDLRRNLALGFSYDMATGVEESAARTSLEFSIIYSGFFMEKSMVPKKASTEFF